MPLHGAQEDQKMRAIAAFSTISGNGFSTRADGVRPAPLVTITTIITTTTGDPGGGTAMV